VSAPLFADDVKFLQRMLCAAGCYAGAADGVWNKAVEVADDRLVALSETIAQQLGVFDLRSERNIRTLHPEAQKAARLFLGAVRAAGIDARIISGTRTYAEQDTLYAVGRNGDTRAPVTNARGGQSNHNFGIAWDGTYLTNEIAYENAAKLCPQGIEWGGSWKSFRDGPHYQLAVGKSLIEVRACFEQGKPFLNAAV
jgi:peptidoglycan L-alanyl-D-glutamate endopeptidase CwlK